MEGKRRIGDRNVHIWPLETGSTECEACADMGKRLLTVRDSYSESLRPWVGSQEEWRVWRVFFIFYFYRRRGSREDDVGDVGQVVRRI